MDFRLLGRFIIDKLHDRTTYVLAAIVGLLINGYGQLLVPWFRSGTNPFTTFMTEFDARPGLTIFSVFLAFAFPFCVGIYSAVAERKLGCSMRTCQAGCGTVRYELLEKRMLDPQGRPNSGLGDEVEPPQVGGENRLGWRAHRTDREAWASRLPSRSPHTPPKRSVNPCSCERSGS